MSTMAAILLGAAAFYAVVGIVLAASPVSASVATRYARGYFCHRDAVKTIC